MIKVKKRKILLLPGDGIGPEVIAEVKKIKIELGKKDAEKKNQAQKILDQIKGKEYTIKKLSTENKELYGSVKPTEIAKLIEENDKLQIKPSTIQPITEIKSIGKFTKCLEISRLIFVS